MDLEWLYQTLEQIEFGDSRAVREAVQEKMQAALELPPGTPCHAVDEDWVPAFMRCCAMLLVRLDRLDAAREVVAVAMPGGTALDKSTAAQILDACVTVAGKEHGEIPAHDDNDGSRG